MRIDEPCTLDVGTKDAIHVPFIVIESAIYWDLEPGCFVRFTDETFTDVEKVQDRYRAHGIVNPFCDAISPKVVILLIPGITTPVRHDFKIDPKMILDKMTEHQKQLELELEQIKKDDPNCADCWHIENGRLERY